MLSPAQELAATAPGHVVIAACPGSGKTTVLKHRAQKLLEQDTTARLAAVTFTRDAADSLKSRIAKQYPPGATRLDAGTFHALCIKQLKAAGSEIRLIEGPSASGMIRHAMNHCPAPKADLEYEDFLAAIEGWQREVSPALPPKESSALAWVYHEYTRLKAQQGLVDFGDLIRDAVAGMQAGKIAPLNVRFMLVDEFQDSDAMQLLWVLEHAKAGVEVTIVGDDDQAIYGFRGSLGYEGMLSFKEQTGATLINLDRTYRCPVEVLRPAAVLIAHNIARVPKELATACSTPGQVHVRTFEDRIEEAKAVVEAIAASGDPASWGILARTNAQLDQIDAFAGNQGIPINRKEGKSFWEIKGPSNLLSLAKSIANRDMGGLVELMTMADVPRKHLDDMAREFEFSKPGSLDRFLKGSFSGRNTAFIELLQGQSREWRQMFASKQARGIPMVLGGMCNLLTTYGGWKTKEALDVSARLQMAASSLGSMTGPIHERLRAVSSASDNKKDGAVALMTLHASKGLEFENVWIIGCDAGVLPSTKEDADLNEERRLLYVGITRSMRNLTLSHTLEKGHSPLLRECALIGSSLFSTPADGVDVAIG